MMDGRAAGAAELIDDDYIPGYSLDEYRRFMLTFSRFHDVVSFDETDVAEVLRALRRGNEFDDDVSGRGDTYRLSQRHPSVRSRGIRTLLELALDGPVPAGAAPDLRVLDVLGGDGTLARAVAAAYPTYRDDPFIMTGDLSRNMIVGALRYGLPAVCQPAQRLLLRNETFDAVMLAYGTHHIPVPERKTAYSEAWRVLKPGGRIVVHDFEEDGPVATWFSEVVHRYAPNGHDYPHFRRSDLLRDLSSVGFTDIEVRQVYDPFTVGHRTAEEALRQLLSYVGEMYGLFRLMARPDWREDLRVLVERHIRYPDRRPAEAGLSLRESPSGWTATMPRVALVAVGVRPR